MARRAPVRVALDPARDRRDGTSGADNAVNMLAGAVPETDGFVMPGLRGLPMPGVRGYKAAAEVAARITPRDQHRVVSSRRQPARWRFPLPEIGDRHGVLSMTTPAIYDFSAIDKTAATGDEEILRLFEQWIGERLAARLVAEDEEAYEAKAEQAEATEAQILLTPAIGAAGLAVKFFLGFHIENSGPDDTITRHNTPGELAALRDAVRFAPVLEPLCCDYLASEKRPLGYWVFDDDGAVAAVVRDRGE